MPVRPSMRFGVAAVACAAAMVWLVLPTEHAVSPAGPTGAAGPTFDHAPAPAGDAARRLRDAERAPGAQTTALARRQLPDDPELNAADKAALQQLLDQVATNRRMATVLVEVLSCSPQVSGLAETESGIALRHDAESVQLVVLEPGDQQRMEKHDLITAFHRPVRNQRRYGFSQPLGRLLPGDVRRAVVLRSPHSSQAVLLWAGPRVQPPQDLVGAEMPRVLFHDLARSASVIRGRVRRVGSRPTDRARQRLGFPATIDCVDVEILDVVQNKHALFAGAVVRLDVLPLEWLRLAGATLDSMPGRRSTRAPVLEQPDYEAGTVAWFAVRRSWRELAIARMVK